MSKLVASSQDRIFCLFWGESCFFFIPNVDCKSEENLKWGKTASEFIQNQILGLKKCLTMKKILFLGLILSGFSNLAGAQKLRTLQVPAAARQAFAKAHPNTTATWEKEEGRYEANFSENGKTMSCVIDSRGTIVETETDIMVDSLPQAARKYISDHYKGVAISEASRIVRRNGVVNYEALVKGKDLLFDGNGKFIKANKEKD